MHTAGHVALILATLVPGAPAPLPRPPAPVPAPTVIGEWLLRWGACEGRARFTDVTFAHWWEGAGWEGTYHVEGRCLVLHYRTRDGVPWVGSYEVEMCAKLREGQRYNFRLRPVPVGE